MRQFLSKISARFNNALDAGYIRVKFRIFRSVNKPKHNPFTVFFLKISKLYLKFLHYLILLCKGSNESFAILKEDLFQEFSELIENTKSKKKSRIGRLFLKFIIYILKKLQSSFYLLKDDVFAVLNDTLDRIDEYKSDDKLEKAKETIKKIKNKSDVDESSLLELEKELFEYNKYKRKKAAVLSISTISTLAIAVISITFISTVLFPQAMKIRAANYGFVQTDWSGGASTTAIALGLDNLTGWTYYFSKENVSTTTPGQLSLDLTAINKKIETTNADFQTHSTSSTYYADGSVGIAKPNGFSCSASVECDSGFCVDGVCCNTACDGSTCQRCDSYSSAGAGTCGYAASNQDPDNECNGGGCVGTGNCSGTGYSCATVAADTDPNDACAAYTCANYIYGWSGSSCVLYSGASAHNGMCDGSGSCYNIANSCSGIGAQSGSASCGSAGCKSSCVTGGLATNYNTVSEVCYTSGQASCGAGSYCNSSGTCINPCAGQPQDSQPSGCNSTCQYCDSSGVCRTMRWALAGSGGGYNFGSGTSRYCKPSTQGQQGVTNEGYSGSMPCNLAPAAAWGGACCGQYLWTCSY